MLPRGSAALPSSGNDETGDFLGPPGIGPFLTPDLGATFFTPGYYHQLMVDDCYIW